MSLKPITLKGEQKRVLFLPVTEPIQIKGVAGSGKTTVALYRAKHLVDTQSNLFEDAKVALFTYNKSLVKYIKAVMPYITGGYQKDSDSIKPQTPAGLKIHVTNFDYWAYHFLQSNGINLKGKIIEPKAQTILVERAIADSKKNSSNSILLKKPEFFLEEISWIMGKLFTSEESYLEAKRIGRGNNDRVTKADKEIIWEIYLNYKKQKKAFVNFDFDDLAPLCLEVIEANVNFTPPFSHLIVDEAQDLSKAEMLVLSKLVSQATKSISIIADAAQRIYKSGFTWSEIGINVVGGRTSVFKKNYRNTENIVKAASSLLAKELDQSDFTAIEAARKGGDKPVVGCFENWNQQAEYAISILEQLQKENQSTVLLHRDHAGIRRIKTFLTSFGLNITEILNNEIDFEDEHIKLCTLSSIKGLEFDNVIILDLNDDIIPYPPGFSDENDEMHISTERRLLYTAMTRAREKLFLFSSGTPSRYLSEIDERFVERIDA